MIMPATLDLRSTSPADTSGSGSPAVEALLKLIEQLEKQLQREQQELRTASAQSSPGNPATLARVIAAQSGVATTLGQLQSAMQTLAEALTQMGDSSSGTLLNTTA